MDDPSFPLTSLKKQVTQLSSQFEGFRLGLEDISIQQEPYDKG